MKRFSILLGGILTAGMMFAAEGTGPQLRSPVLGYVFDDEAKAIRTVSGIPGAASFGEAISLPTTLTNAYVHSGARVAAAVTKEGQLALVTWNAGSRVTILESSLGALKIAAFSRSGRSVGLSDGATLEIWSSGTGALVSRHHSDSEIKAVAVNDSGTALASTTAGTIVRFSDAAEQAIAGGAEWTALAYASEGSDAIAADATHNELVRITPEGGRSVIAALPGGAAALAAGNNGVYFVSSPSWGLYMINGSVSGAVVCDCQPKGLDRLEGDAVHVRGTSLVLDVEGDEPRRTLLPNLFSVGVKLVGVNQQ